MNLSEAIATLSDKLEDFNREVDCVLKAFSYARDTCSEDEWDAWTNDKRLGHLLDALSDLEYTLEGPDKEPADGPGPLIASTISAKLGIFSRGLNVT